MQVGQQVVCIDDTFLTKVACLYTALPIKDQIYTIRAVYVGRSAKDATLSEIGLLLQELVNPPDARHKGCNELGFNSERFKLLDKVVEEYVEQSSGTKLVGEWQTHEGLTPK